MVLNCGLVTAQNSENTRNGRHFEIKIATGKAGIRNLREQSYQSHGAKLFNAMPAYLRKLTKISQDDFKIELDQYLQKIPDQPKIDGLIPGTTDHSGRLSNSLLQQTKRGQAVGLRTDCRA